VRCEAQSPSWKPFSVQTAPRLASPDSEISIDDLNDEIAEAQQVVHDVLRVDVSFVLRLVQAIRDHADPAALQAQPATYRQKGRRLQVDGEDPKLLEMPDEVLLFPVQGIRSKRESDVMSQVRRHKVSVQSGRQVQVGDSRELDGE
jgi:hypothetical protein